MLFSSPSRKYNKVVLLKEEIGKSITKPINKCHKRCAQININIEEDQIPQYL